MVIKKIKYKNERLHIEWQDSIEEDANKFSIDSKLTPPASFLNALMGLRTHVNEICELGLKNEELHKIVVTGISFSHTNGILGAVIIAQKVLENSTTDLSLITPHKSEDFYSKNGEGDQKQLHTPDCIAALKLLELEAENFLESEPAQLNLFDGKKQ